MKHKTTWPSGPKTAELARALPEVTRSELMSSGELAFPPISGDDIALFSDVDGRAMRPVFHNGAWHKTEVRL